MPLLDSGLTPGELTAEHGDRRRVIHSDHYNLALVRTLLTQDGIDARSIVETAVAELSFQTLRERASAERWRGGERWLTEAVSLFSSIGLGSLDLGGVGEGGGEARVGGSHFTHGWVQKHGRSKQPVCAVAAGFLAGALAAAYDRPYRVAETGCVAQGKAECRFRITPAEGAVPFAARTPDFEPAPIAVSRPGPTDFDELAVVAALLDVRPNADAEGRIPAFGGTVTRLWSDFYNRVSYRFEREVPRALGNKFANLPSLVLIEAGHTCAFHTFGGIMRSDDWRERVAPLLRSREEWLHAAVAVINTLGWGTWRIRALVPGECATVRVYDSYEAAGYRADFGRAASAKCYFARGTLAALMNLLYVGDVSIVDAPELTPSYYNQLFRSPLSFRAVEARCRATDDPHCELIANPLSGGLTRLLAKAMG